MEQTLMPDQSLLASLRDAAEQPEQHSLGRSIFLHLMPGVIITAAYTLLAPVLLARGLPNLLTLSLVALLVLVPLELGILYRAGLRRSGRLSLSSVVLYRERVPAWQFVLLLVALFAWTSVCFLLIAPSTSAWMKATLFGWLPAWFPLNADLSPYPRSMQLLTLVASLVCTSWIAPFVEELYFRGYLLPRLSRFGGWAAPINAVLFTLYHFFSPWELVPRVLSLTPLAWVVQRKRNIWIGIVLHLFLNSIGVIPAIIALMVG